MAIEEHLEVLRQGADAWNRWRRERGEAPNLAGASLVGIDRPREAARPIAKGYRTRLGNVDFSDAYLGHAFMEFVTLDGADLRGANLDSAILKRASLRGADLTGAYLKDANLRSADLRDANLTDANLMRATLVETDLRGARLRGCNIYGAAVWGIQVDEHTDQSGLLVQNYNEPAFQVPGLEVAQLIHMLRNHKKLRDVLLALTEKAVLLLGRFTDPERRAALDAMYDSLQAHGYLPILFDFEQIPGRDLTETIQTLAGLSRFVVADLTAPRSVQQEATAILRSLEVPFVPVIADGEAPWSMFADLARGISVVPGVRYSSIDALRTAMPELIDAADARRDLLVLRKSGPPPPFRRV